MPENTRKKIFNFLESYDQLLLCDVREKDGYHAQNGKKQEAFEKTRELFVSKLPERVICASESTSAKSLGDRYFKIEDKRRKDVTL